MSTTRNASKTKTFICLQCSSVAPWKFNSKNMYCSRQCLSMSQRGRKVSAEQLAQMRANGKRLAADPDHLRKIAKGWFKPGDHPSPATEFKAGREAPMKGRKHTAESLARMTEANRQKSWKTAGQRCHLWKGGITPQRLKDRVRFVATTRAEAMKRDNYTCQDCGKRGGYLHVDHIKDWANNPDLRFDVTNCRTLCIDCHYLKTFGHQRPAGSRWGMHTNVIQEAK